jgi:hypothetical protein
MCYEVLGTYEEPGTLTQGAPVFPGSSRLGIEPKTPGWLVQGRTTSPVTQLRLGEVTVGGVCLLLMCVTAGPSAAVTCAGRVSEAAACHFLNFRICTRFSCRWKIRKRVAKRTFEAHDLMLRSYYAVKFSSSSSVDFSRILGNSFALQHCLRLPI